MLGIESDQLYLFVILMGAVILLFTEWIRIDLTAILIIVMLGLTGVLAPEAALSGFSSEPAILLAAELLRLWPGSDLNRVFFTDDGSTAVEVAVKIAFQY